MLGPVVVYYTVLFREYQPGIEGICLSLDFISDSNGIV